MASSPDYNSDDDNGGAGTGRPFFTWSRPITALVVDSAVFYRTYERAVLIVYGAQAEAVSTGNAALELIYSGRTYDLIVVDQDVDDATGIQITRQLRDFGVDSMIVGLTDVYSEEQRSAFMAVGGDNYIEKPFTPDKIVPILIQIDNEH